MTTNEATVKVEVVGAQSMIEAIERSRDKLVGYRNRLVDMGWTEHMADEFIGDIAETIVREFVEVKPVE